MQSEGFLAWESRKDHNFSFIEYTRDAPNPRSRKNSTINDYQLGKQTMKENPNEADQDQQPLSHYQDFNKHLRYHMEYIYIFNIYKVKSGNVLKVSKITTSRR